MEVVEQKYSPEGMAYLVEQVASMPSNDTDIDRIMETYEGLQPRERKILDLYFGISFQGYIGNEPIEREPMNLREIGEMEGCTRERIGQIKERAIVKMRKNLEEELI